MGKKITISLVAYNGSAYLPYCLPSVFNQICQDWELVILDNGSDDNSSAVITEITGGRVNVKILPPEPKNIGFAAGHNKIIKERRAEFVLLLNQDTLIEPDYIAKLMKFMENNPPVGAVSGKILRWNFKYAHKLTSNGKTDIIDTAGLRLSPSFQITDIGAGGQDNRQYDGNRAVFGVSGCLPLYRREALKQVGYFDESFFSYKEDVDLAFRLQSAGWQAWNIGSAAAYHERKIARDESTGGFKVINRRLDRSSFANYFSYRNHLFVLIKNLSVADFVRYGIFISWYEFKKFLYILLLEQKTLYAWTEVIKRLPRLLKERQKIKPKSVKRWIQ
ncbi:hypothetical protein COU00_02460 [Candidatus Falkowbacteria bacterium CG10_big_fil_rev_8_21_14_0_10_43_11]|uniref:Glycosyltransferase 2-like domain-containing protein n=1 Tax=Candidatus Falkowbacteria bacterium CG10_big_fil_rev_8_21_14_0_10_43_11 TaxID=1974568 RepID=A0A2M6WLZ5_9BACT|nr:MAG: hypothetical protein COU00_02460 [Candidatus Falkowbacteria bacterium CG10_big_fil_rev_8_21_14_0_10_43_11]